MANIVDNLRILGLDVKTIYFKDSTDSTILPPGVKVKEFYFNNNLIWKNANPFLFVTDVSHFDPADYGENTLIFEGFDDTEFLGSYSIVENAEAEKGSLVLGQMVVEEPSEGDE